MTEFRTQVDIKPSPWRTGYGRKHLFVGSCFTENIGDRMENLKFPVLINPFGIVYNPVSVAESLQRLINGQPWEMSDLFCHNGLWHSFDHHGRYSSESAEETLRTINDALFRGAEFLRQADFLFLTFGTAWVFERAATGKIVANCHKAPAGEFRRYRLSIGEIVQKLRDTLEEVWKIVPALKIIFTVSPVRHLSDGAVENQLSKSVLLLAVDALVKGYGKERCAYFPAYELVMDELRDYRFYAGDMVHISPVATDFVWGKFMDWILSDESIDLSRKIAQIVKAKEHRPFFRNTPEYRQFIETTLRKSIELARTYPETDMQNEIDYFSNELKTFPPLETGMNDPIIS